MSTCNVFRIILTGESKIMLSPYKNASVIDFGQAELAYQVFKTGALNSLQIYRDTFACCCKLREDKLCKI